jgi:DNA-directed RNA polymerase subunit RPC12/RpoP
MYHVKYVCSNCGHRFGQSFPKGEKAPERVLCPNCGIHAGLKEWANQPENSLKVRIIWGRRWRPARPIDSFDYWW